MKANLPISFSYNSAKDLIRLGKNYDGGYLISKNDISYSEILISLGVCDDWSFENDFLRYNKIPIFAFDGTIGLNTFALNIFKSLGRFDNPKFMPYAFKTFLYYLIFFRGTKKHIQRNISYKVKNNSNYISIKDVFNSTLSKKIFLKIDIEGSEYRLLDELLINQERIVSLVIEFHDFDLHIEKIKRFKEKFNLDLIHIHPNNYGNIEGDEEIPSVIEMTFSRKYSKSKACLIPHELDMPNNPKVKQIVIDFKDF